MESLSHKRKLILFICSAFIIAGAAMAYAAEQSSANYTIGSNVIAGGGGYG